MDSSSLRYAPTVLNAESALVSAERPTGLAFTTGATSRSAPVPSVATALTAPAGQPPRTTLRIALNALPRLLVLNAPYVNVNYDVTTGVQFTASAQVPINGNPTSAVGSSISTSST